MAVTMKIAALKSFLPKNPRKKPPTIRSTPKMYEYSSKNSQRAFRSKAGQTSADVIVVW